MKYFLVIVFVTAGMVFGSGSAEAHTLEVDGSIHGVMHITPAHKPTAGEPSRFEFFMMNANTTFDPKAYVYVLEITGGDMATATVPVTSKGATLYAEYTFPNEGKNYSAILTGSSTISSQPSFVLNFDDIFVYPPGQHENPIENLLSDHIAHVILVALIIGAFGGIVAWDTFVVRKRPVQLPPK